MYTRVRAVAIAVLLIYAMGCQQSDKSGHKQASEAPPSASSGAASPSPAPPPAPVQTATGSETRGAAGAGAGATVAKKRKAAKRAANRSHPANDDLRAALTSEMQKLNVGKIDYNPPADMKVDETTLVSARIYRHKDAQVSSADLLGNGPIKQSELKVADNMLVSLSAAEPSDFEITAVAPKGENQEQFIEEDGHADWVWSVKPLKAGQKHLLLVATVVLHTHGLTETKTINTFNTTITVKVVPHPWQRAGNFIAANWQWLWTTLLVPLGGWLLRRVIKTRKQLPEESEASSRPAPEKPRPERAEKKSA